MNREDWPSLQDKKRLKGVTTMAHNLINAAGKVEFVSVREVPWHGLGELVKDAMTTEQATIKGGLGWSVFQQDIRMDVSGELIEGFKCNYRMMSKNGVDFPYPLGIVKSGYKVIQNREAFDFFDTVIGRKEAIFETAGAINSGKKVFLTAKLNGEMVVGNKDVVNKYLMLATSHDGTMTCRMFWTPIRVVCNNTLTAAISRSDRAKSGEETGIKIRHSGKIEDKVEEAINILGIANKRYQELEKLYNDLYKHMMNPDSVADYFKAVLPDNEDPSKNNTFRVNSRQQMMRLYMDGAGAELARGTLWGAYNAVTEFVDHAKRSEDANANFNRVLFGSGYQMKNRALSLAADAVGVKGTV